MLGRLALCALLLVGCNGKDKEKDKPPPAADKPVETPAVAPKPPADSWTTYTSKEGKFTVELPVAPKVQGAMALAEFGATASDPRTSGCGVTFVANPNPAAPAADVLTAMSRGYKTDATIIEDKDITLGTHAGRSLVIENSKHRKWLHLFLIDDKIFLLNCGAPFDRGDQDAPTAKRVLDSFKLTP